MKIRVALFALMIVAGIAATAHAKAYNNPNPLVQVIEIDNTIDAGMAHHVQRAVQQAQSEGAAAILVVLKTNGGIVDDANDIRDAFSSSGIQTIAFVQERAWSAGALIALACDKIYMAPGSSMGAAEPRPYEAKYVSAIRAEFQSLAETHHRNPNIAAGMTDRNIVIPGLKAKGEILTLSPEAAKKFHFIDGIASNQIEVLALAGIRQARLQVAEPTLGERIAQFIADPIVSEILVAIGVLGLLIEMQTLHLIAGIIGVAALALFFGAHIVAGLANWVVVVLFALGVLGLLFELHVLPGHGISGLVGAVLIISSIVMTFGFASVFAGIIATGTSLIAAVAIFFLALRWLPESAFMRRLAFAGAQSIGEGYTAAAPVIGLENAEGVAESYLRPAGVASIAGTRYLVQTDGEFIPAQTRIRVKRVEGAKIIVTRA